jgi:hypothetical protein
MKWVLIIVGVLVVLAIINGQAAQSQAGAPPPAHPGGEVTGVVVGFPQAGPAPLSFIFSPPPVTPPIGIHTSLNPPGVQAIPQPGPGPSFVNYLDDRPPPGSTPYVNWWPPGVK